MSKQWAIARDSDWIYVMEGDLEVARLWAWPARAEEDAAFIVAARKALEEDDWFEMESAPTNGTPILVAEEDGTVTEAWFDNDACGNEGWYAANIHWTDPNAQKLEPVAWRYLPTAPKKKVKSVK